MLQEQGITVLGEKTFWYETSLIPTFGSLLPKVVIELFQILILVPLNFIYIKFNPYLPFEIKLVTKIIKLMSSKVVPALDILFCIV